MSDTFFVLCAVKAGSSGSGGRNRENGVGSIAIIVSRNRDDQNSRIDIEYVGDDDDDEIDADGLCDVYFLFFAVAVAFAVMWWRYALHMPFLCPFFCGFVFASVPGGGSQMNVSFFSHWVIGLCRCFCLFFSIFFFSLLCARENSYGQG
ncbi:hypothetical protein TcG_05095 [Trypanosoma cruzi]|nr:hypothetical protein TcG_05095 [Trypanosoma cruzi]